MLRADNYGWGNANYNAAHLSSDYNWNTFRADMDGALVEVTVSYETSGRVDVQATTTTQSGHVYHYSYWQTGITTAQLGIFFTVERAHISEVGPDGQHLGIEAIQPDASLSPTVIHDLQGRRLDALHPGLNIINGRKVLIR